MSLSQGKVRLLTTMKRSAQFSIQFAIALVIFGAACSREGQPAAKNPDVPAPAVASAPARPAAANTTAPKAPDGARLTGKVIETFNAAGYTYVRLETPAGETWAAIQETKLKKGEDVAIEAQMTMEKFKSKALNRTFDKIVFGAMVGEGEAPTAMPPAGKMPAGHPAAGAQMPARMEMSSAEQHMKAPDIGAIKVPKAEGGKTVAEVWASRTSLNGKEVVVRGKVVKFLAGIMGRNWIHLQDGTGAVGTNDLTVTTEQTAAVGDVVAIKGTLAVDKDFGGGYRYDVIVEKASVTK